MTAPAVTLEELGWRTFFSDQLSNDERERCHPVRVMAVHRGTIAVAGAVAGASTGGVTDTASPSVILSHIQGAQSPVDHPTVGDWLLIDRATRLPARVLDRRNLFKRRAPGNPRKEQMIAANVDTVFIVASCNQDFNVARLERYLVLSREIDVTPVVVLTKTDLIATADDFAAAARAIQPGLLVETVDGRDPASVARLAPWCGVGRTVALLGSSGVGKSTLVNTLRRSDSIATQPIRARDGTGQHTTTVREMHRLDHGGWLLDTPGMRELQLPDTAAGTSDVFDDFVLAAQRCRFSNCGHDGEPDCAVRSAIDRGELTSERFDRWRRLTAERPGTSRRGGRHR